MYHARYRLAWQDQYIILMKATLKIISNWEPNLIYSVFIYSIFSLKRLRLKRNIYEPNSTNGLELVENNNNNKQIIMNLISVLLQSGLKFHMYCYNKITKIIVWCTCRCILFASFEKHTSAN